MAQLYVSVGSALFVVLCNKDAVQALAAWLLAKPEIADTFNLLVMCLRAFREELPLEEVKARCQAKKIEFYYVNLDNGETEHQGYTSS